MRKKTRTSIKRKAKKKDGVGAVKERKKKSKKESCVVTDKLGRRTHR